MVKYTKGKTPKENGVYAVRVSTKLDRIYEDKFLLWYDNEWSHLGSDQFFRETKDCQILGYIGPLQRRIDKD